MICKIIVIALMLMCVQGRRKEYLDLEEGSKCSKDGVDGVCANVYNCLNAAEDVKKGDYPWVCKLQGEIPIICCTDCELVNDTRTMFISPTTGKLYFPNGQKARDKCLDYNQQIYGCQSHISNMILLKKLDKERNCYTSYSMAPGALARVKWSEFPHMALLGYGADEDSAQWLCGGSLISENFVLTAGQCISSPSLGIVKYIALGILKRTDPPEFRQKYDVERIIAHPEYRPPSKYNDIALLETRTRVSITFEIRPVCLHFERDVDCAWAIGWRPFGFDEVYQQKFPEEECSEIYLPHRHLKNGYDHNTQMCYGNHRETLPCEGDIGDPLQGPESASYCQWTLIGVTSASKQCGLNASTGLYTKVANYLPWIEDIVWP